MSVTNYSKNSRGPSANGILERSAAAFGKNRRPESRDTSVKSKPGAFLNKLKFQELPEVRGRQPSQQNQLNRINKLGQKKESNSEFN